MNPFKSVKIGTVTVPHGIFLAPMAGVTDCCHRMICAAAGAEYTVSEMISAAALCYGDKKTGALARVCPGEAPAAIQIFGHDPAQMNEAADILLSGAYPGTADISDFHGIGDGYFQTKPPAIDINMGCPVKKIVSSGDGSALMRSPERCGDITAAVRRVCDKHGIAVTVKIRSGWDFGEINAPEVALAAAENGAGAIFVHGRTRSQMYAPSADPAVIAAVREALPAHIPVIGNGDIRCAADAVRMLNETGCDGIMIGREAMGNPWVFAAVRRAAEGMEPDAADSISVPDSVRRAAAMHMVRCVCHRMGEESGVKACRGRVSHFIKGMRGASAVRSAVTAANTQEDIYDALYSVENRE